MEIIKTKHTPAAVIIVLASFFVVRDVASGFSVLMENIYSSIPYAIVIIGISLVGIGLQYIENKYLWGRLLVLSDNLSFFGVSIGITVGILSLGLW